MVSIELPHKRHILRRITPTTYIVYRDNNKYYAINGITNATEYSSEDATSVIQYAVDKTHNSGGGRVLIKKGTYVFHDLTNKNVGVVLRPGVEIVGEKGVEIIASDVADPATYRSVFFGDNINDVSIRNLKIRIKQSGWYAGVYIWYGLERVKIEDVEIESDIGWYAYGQSFTVGIRVVVGDGGRCTELTIRRSKILNTGYGIGIGTAIEALKADMRDIIIENNYVDLYQTVPLATSGIIIGTNGNTLADNITVRNNTVKRVGDSGIEVAYANNVAIEGNTVEDATIIFSRSVNNGVIRGNTVITKNYRSLVGYFLVEKVLSKNIAILNNLILNGNIAIWPSNITEYSFDGLLIGSNVIVSNYIFGIQAQLKEWTKNVTITNNIVINKYKDGTSYGIFLTGSEYGVITNNIVYVDNPNNEARALTINACRNILITNNYIYGTGSPLCGYYGAYWGHHYIMENVLPSICPDPNNPPSPVILKRNIGYTTEKIGVATIPAGSTRVTVSHGLYRTPSTVLLTPYGNIKVWVENITPTSFDIVTDTAPTSNTKVAWYAEV